MAFTFPLKLCSNLLLSLGLFLCVGVNQNFWMKWKNKNASPDALEVIYWNQQSNTQIKNVDTQVAWNICLNCPGNPSDCSSDVTDQATPLKGTHQHRWSTVSVTFGWTQFYETSLLFTFSERLVMKWSQGIGVLHPNISQRWYSSFDKRLQLCVIVLNKPQLLLFRSVLWQGWKHCCH